MDDDTPDALFLPAGHSGLKFSGKVPGEIDGIDEESPILARSVQFIGRIVSHVSIPNTIDVSGALDSVTLDTILTTYSNIPNRKLLFHNRGDSSEGGIVTATVLPKGPVNASFKSSRGLIKSLTRIYVERAPPNKNYEYPVGHFVKKVIIPNRLELEGSGLGTTQMLRQTLDRFADVEGRTIVFQKKSTGNFPRPKSESKSKPKSKPKSKSKNQAWEPLGQCVEI